MELLKENDCTHADGTDCKLSKFLCVGYSMVSVDMGSAEDAFDRDMLKKCKDYEPCRR